MEGLDNTLTVSARKEMYKQVIEYSFDATIIHSDHAILYVNQAGEEFLGAKKEMLIGQNVCSMIKEEDVTLVTNRISEIMSQGRMAERVELTLIRVDGHLVDVELTCIPVLFGNQPAIQTVIRDITENKMRASELLEIRNEIYEISTAIVPVSDGVSIIPLGGRLSDDRVDQLLDTIPLKLKDEDLDYLIIDFSGVYKLDELMVSFLFNIHDIIRLLGIHPIFTGIRPELARKAVQIGKDLSDMHTLGTVKQAIQYINKRKK
ncbi:PAS domain S-box protein [Halobacillus sp. Marseille-Q1614]|uniref:PAS domain S-box protein n=1 Tax=Halobacillus sp. Marseille-Q1614 TaxID=2709134 RepID=UPI00156F4352|nr:PAS domain S-box protein [Halobacillus sp. Marseille-Q1614]